MTPNTRSRRAIAYSFARLSYWDLVWNPFTEPCGTIMVASIRRSRSNARSDRLARLGQYRIILCYRNM
jgi:hypothetical protein